MQVGPTHFAYLNQPASGAGDLTFTFNGFTLSSFVIDVFGNPDQGGITIMELGAGGTVIGPSFHAPLVKGSPRDVLTIDPPSFYAISEPSSVLTGFRISSLGNAVVYEAGSELGLATTVVDAAAVPEPGPAVLIFAAMLLFALRALAQQYGLWRDRLERNRITGRT